MAGMGPPPKPPGTARRRNAAQSFTQLPSAGRKGPAPKWPLLEDLSLLVKRSSLIEKADELQAELEATDSLKTRKRIEASQKKVLEQVKLVELQIETQKSLEVTLWDELWTTPQAEIWERLAWSREVAQYVRWKVLAEMGNIEAAKEARMWSDRLGLNPLAMLRLRWQIEQTEAAETAGAKRRETASRERQQAASRTDPRKGLHAV